LLTWIKQNSCSPSSLAEGSSKFILEVSSTNPHLLIMSNPQSDIQINPRAEPQIEREMDSEKKADAYDPVVRTESDDVEQGKVRPFLGAQHQDIIPDSIGPNFIRAEHVRRGLSQRHIQVSLRLNG